MQHAERRERNGRQDYLVNILRSELQAATAFMEHRERWWNEGLQNAKSYVGMEMDRVRASEQNTEQAMNTQMTTLVETLRAAQGRAELSSLALIDQQRIANDLEQYANKLNAQGRAIINDSEQKHWSIVTELAQVRSELARVETEAERKIRMTLAACETQSNGLELSARAADMRAHLVYNEYRSAQSEVNELKESRLAFGLEGQIAIESIRGTAADTETRMRAENQQLRHELQICEASASGDANKMESTAILKEVLKQAQVSWSTADAECRFPRLQQKELDNAQIEQLREELATKTHEAIQAMRSRVQVHAAPVLSGSAAVDADAVYAEKDQVIQALNAELQRGRMVGFGGLQRQQFVVGRFLAAVLADHVKEIVELAVFAVRGNEGAATLLADDDFLGHQFVEGFADGAHRNAEVRGQPPFARDGGARLPLAGNQAACDAVLDLF